MKRIVQGVYLDVMPSRKYKTNMLMVKCILPYQVELASYWSIISRMMEDGSIDICSRTELEQRLAHLYGAELGISTRRHGNYLEFTLTSKIVRSDLLLTSEDLIGDWLQLIKNILFNQSFDSTTISRFQREQRLLLQELEREKEDRTTYAVRRFFDEVYGMNSKEACGSMGTYDLIKQAQLESIKKAYSLLIQNSQIHIVVHGAIPESQIEEWVLSWSLTDRHVAIDYAHNQLPIPTTVHKEWQEDLFGEQTNVVLGYAIPTPHSFYDCMLISVCNALFGGMSTSALFTHIREKRGLAYSIVSHVELQRGLILVNTGVNLNQSQHVIDEIRKIQQNLTETIEQLPFSEIKQMLLHHELQSRDDQEVEVTNVLSHFLLPEFDLSLQNFYDTFAQITQDDVLECFKKWQYVGSFLLKGGEPNAT